MTAEIAIINRSAVALATDSAVTLQVRGMDKVYNSADKLFELSNKDPFGIMIYNNLEFMGLSLEVLIKQFRDQKGNVHYASVSDIAAAFFDYMTQQCSGESELQKLHAMSIIDAVISELRMNWHKELDVVVITHGPKTDYPGLLSKNIDEMIETFAGLDDADGFYDASIHDVIKVNYADTFAEARDRYFGRLPLEDDHKSKIDRLCFLALTKNQYSQFFTGMVFAGFGQNEQFPSLISFELDGVIADVLKQKNRMRLGQIGQK